MTDPASPRLSIDQDRLIWSGDWTAETISQTKSLFKSLRVPVGDIEADLSGLGKLDSAGAWFISRTLRQWQRANTNVQLSGMQNEHQALIKLVDKHAIEAHDFPVPKEHGFFEDIGRDAHDTLINYLAFLAFIGRLTFHTVRIAFTPAVLRWSSAVKHVENAGFDGLPIVGLLTFLLGMVIAYQGGNALATYGASIYTADLVGLTMVRELSPLITAIIVAGRTGSAYTAQIATMKVTEEIDALRTMGISPLEELALPKFVALLVSLPLLTVFGDIMGLLGGMVMANSLLDVSFTIYVDRVTNTVSPQSFLIGICKAPVFALMIASVGCYQGFQVKPGAEQVGHQTTISVVQSIFLVIVTDAIFAIIFSKLGI